MNTKGQADLTVCPLKLVWHIPCPACGITRATLLALHSNIAEAIQLNPNVIFSVGFLIGFPFVICYDILFRKKLLLTLCNLANSCCHQRVFLAIFFLTETAIWLHNIIHCNF